MQVYYEIYKIYVYWRSTQNASLRNGRSNNSYFKNFSEKNNN